MAYDVSLTSKMDARNSYEKSVEFLAKNGFKVMHKRDFAWLIQVSKVVEGKTRVISVTCRAGQPTPVSLSCLTAQPKPDEGEINFTDSLAKELSLFLNQ